MDYVQQFNASGLPPVGHGAVFYSQMREYPVYSTPPPMPTAEQRFAAFAAASGSLGQYYSHSAHLEAKQSSESARKLYRSCLPMTNSAGNQRQDSKEEDSQRERKRLLDRLSQRATRDRTKNKIAYLEDLVRKLDTQSESDQIKDLLKQVDDLRMEEGKLKGCLGQGSASFNMSVEPQHQLPSINSLVTPQKAGAYGPPPPLRLPGEDEMNQGMGGGMTPVSAGGYQMAPAQGYPPRRKAIRATQACDACRTRKSKCDEGRPSCTFCKDTGVACVYREVPPPKPKEDKDGDNFGARWVYTKPDHAVLKTQGEQVQDGTTEQKELASDVSPFKQTAEYQQISPPSYYTGGLNHIYGYPPLYHAPAPPTPSPRDSTYSYMPTIEAQQHKRPRRRYEEIEKMYKCGWNHVMAGQSPIQTRSLQSSRRPSDPAERIKASNEYIRKWRERRILKQKRWEDAKARRPAEGKEQRLKRLLQLLATSDLEYAPDTSTSYQETNSTDEIFNINVIQNVLHSLGFLRDGLGCQYVSKFVKQFFNEWKHSLGDIGTSIGSYAARSGAYKWLDNILQTPNTRTMKSTIGRNGISPLTTLGLFFLAFPISPANATSPGANNQSILSSLAAPLLLVTLASNSLSNAASTISGVGMGSLSYSLIYVVSDDDVSATCRVAIFGSWFASFLCYSYTQLARSKARELHILATVFFSLVIDHFLQTSQGVTGAKGFIMFFPACLSAAMFMVATLSTLWNRHVGGFWRDSRDRSDLEWQRLLNTNN